MILTSVLKIYWLAADLVREHGREAELVAAAQIKAMHDLHDLDGENFWRGVLREVDMIQKHEFGRQLRKELGRVTKSDEQSKSGISRLKGKVGEVTMENELLREKIRRRKALDNMAATKPAPPR